MKNLTEESFLSHIKGGKFKEIIDTVLKLHAMFPCPLRCLHKTPYLIKSHSCRDLNGDVLSMLHGIDTHLGVILPVCNDIYKIYVITLTKLLPCILASCVGRNLRMSGTLKALLSLLNHLRLDITYCSNLGTRNMKITRHST